MNNIYHEILLKIRGVIKQILKVILPQSWYEYLKDKKNSLVLKRYINRKNRLEFSYPANILEVKMWGGFSRDAVKDLETLKRSAAVKKIHKRDAAVALARWYTFNNNYELALNNVQVARLLNGKPNKQLVRMESELNMQQGRYAEARSILDQYLKNNDLDNDVCLMVANTLAHQEDPSANLEWFAWVNRVFQTEGLAGVRKIRENEPLSFYNITAHAEPLPARESDPKVSIIMPAYNAQSTIQVAIQSLLNQTWTNFELIIVDDCSTDDTHKVVSEFAQKDPRIILVRQEQNQGAYGARNTGLLRATGDYITVHDADDWSHPQRLEYQINDLLKNSYLVGSLVKMVRVNEALYFNGAWRLGETLIRDCTNGLIFRRDILNQLGAWDVIRVGADTEFIRRIRKIFGNNSLKNVFRQIPFLFMLEMESNLTRQSQSHLKTLYFGVRSDYTEISTYWLEHTDTSATKIDPFSTQHPFKIPEAVKIKPDPKRMYDIVIMANLRSQDSSFTYLYNLILACQKLNMEIALFNYPNYKRLNKHWKPVNSIIYELTKNSHVDRISIADTLKTQWLLFIDPRLLDFKIDQIPKISFEKLVVIANDLNNDSTKQDRRRYRATKIIANLEELFSSTGTWVATSRAIREKMIADARFPTPKEEIWFPFKYPENDSLSTQRALDITRPNPSLGCISFAAVSDWLNSIQEIKDAYCASRSCETLFLGKINRFGTDFSKYLPDNWQILSPDNYSPEQFIPYLDFYLYFPSVADRLPGFDAVLQALESGCIVIAPPELEVDFGGVLVYAAPEAVWDTVQYYWNDKDAAQQQKDRGQAFVSQTGITELVRSRLESI